MPSENEATENKSSRSAEENSPQSEPQEILGEPLDEAQLIQILRSRSGLFNAALAFAQTHQLPGHDAIAYYVTNLSENNVTIVNEFPEGFVHPTYGSQPRYRTMNCNMTSDRSWNCSEI